MFDNREKFFKLSPSTEKSIFREWSSNLSLDNLLTKICWVFVILQILFSDRLNMGLEIKAGLGHRHMCKAGTVQDFSSHHRCSRPSSLRPHGFLKCGAFEGMGKSVCLTLWEEPYILCSWEWLQFRDRWREGREEKYPLWHWWGTKWPSPRLHELLSLKGRLSCLWARTQLQHSFPHGSVFRGPWFFQPPSLPDSC